MHFILIWLFDKLGYMPKIDIQVGKINFEPKIPDLEKPKAAVKKTAARKTPAKKAK
jgi:hypothetical protein